MTRTTNARVAGFMFLFYIATAFPDMLVSQRAMTGGDVAEKLRSIGQHVPLMRPAPSSAWVSQSASTTPWQWRMSPLRSKRIPGKKR